MEPKMKLILRDKRNWTIIDGDSKIRLPVPFIVLSNPETFETHSYYVLKYTKKDTSVLRINL